MSPKRISIVGSSLLAGLPLWLLCVIGYWVYQPALNAPFTYDDAPNLNGLADVCNPQSAFAFILSGFAGPLGRPLSLASFLLNASDWPGHPGAFRYVNVLLHCLNGLLVAWLGIKVIRLLPQPPRHPEVPAIVLAGIWLLHPFLATTPLLVVQRMALLAGTCTLLGLIMFVHGRGMLARKPWVAFACMSIGVGLGALSGALAKETGALLPFFAFVLNWTLLAHLATGQQWRWRLWQAIFFGGPAVLLAAYTVLLWPGIEHGYASRAFDLHERLLTESVILWDYVRQILIPNVTAMGPFQDDVAVQHNLTPVVYSAIAGWAITVLGALALRKRAPWITFGILWFTVGHMLESSVFGLELYFEHRNYLPALGPLAAVVAIAWSTPGPLLRLAVVFLLPLTGALLYQTTSLWGSPLVAGERWAQEHPGSSRALQFLAQRYVLRGDLDAAVRVISHGATENPDSSDLAVQTMQLQCDAVPAEELHAMYLDVLGHVPRFNASSATLSSIQDIRFLISENKCPGLTRQDMVAMLAALLRNRQFHANSRMRSNLHHQLADIYTLEGNLDKTVRNLQAAFADQPNPGTAELLAAVLASAGLYQEAYKSLDDAMKRAPALPIARKAWERRFQRLRASLTALENNARPRGNRKT